MSTTIKSIAEEAQVSFQAVSAVLNNKTNCRVSAETRERILRIAKESGYRKNFTYRLMHHQQTHTAAIILSTVFQLEGEENIRDLIMLLMDKLNMLEYSTYCNNVMEQEPKKNLAKIRELISRGTEHFIFIGSPCGYEAIEAELKKRNLTFVGFKSGFSRNFDVNSAEASAEVLRFFQSQIGNDFKLLLSYENSPEYIFSSARFKGLCKVFPEQDAETLRERYILSSHCKLDSSANIAEQKFKIGYQLTRTAMSLASPPKALIFNTDSFALGGVRYLYEHGIRPGKEILIAGFNNIDAVCYHAIPITSVAYPLAEIARNIIESAFGNDEFQKTIKLNIHFRTENKTL